MLQKGARPPQRYLLNSGDFLKGETATSGSSCGALYVCRELLDFCVLALLSRRGFGVTRKEVANRRQTFGS